MIGILVIAHEPLATALVHCTRHVFRRLPPQVAALDVLPDEDPDQAFQAAVALGERINDGSGLLVFTDVYGATPSRIAERMHRPSRICVFTGVNLPLLLKSMGHRRGVALEELVETLVATMPDGIGPVMPECTDDSAGPVVRGMPGPSNVSAGAMRAPLTAGPSARAAR